MKNDLITHTLTKNIDKIKVKEPNMDYNPLKSI